jgi:predicted amidohydrolase YtcJ
MALRLASVAAFAFLAVSPALAVDLIVHSARIVTLDHVHPFAQALAIDHERIVSIGANAAVLALADPATRIIDAGGRTIIPGLIDSHIHAIRAGLTFAQEASFEGARTIGQAMERLRMAGARDGGDSWIVVGGGWTAQQFIEDRRPTGAEIEAAAPGRRIYVQAFYRAAFLSQGAQQTLGVDAENPPPGTVFERDDSGAATGWLTGDVAAITALWERLPKPGLQEAINSTRAFFAQMNAYGITGVIDPGGHNLARSDYAALFALWRRREMNLRVAYFVSAQTAGAERVDFERDLRFVPMGFGDRWLRFNGIGERVTFGMYNNEKPDAADIAVFEDIAYWAARSGLPMTVHWNNQRSIGPLLDVFDRVGRDFDLGFLRWSVAHIHDAEPETLARLHQSGLGWLTQNAPYFAAPAFIRSMSASRRALVPAISSALAMGMKVGAGTDATRVMSYNPFIALQWLVDGRTIDGQETRAQNQRPSREEALRLWTQGSAWFAFAEGERGTLARGMLADFAVLTDDYFSVPTDRISSIRSWLTVVGGRVVYASP